jgi:hypothetical protein
MEYFFMSVIVFDVNMNREAVEQHHQKASKNLF